MHLAAAAAGGRLWIGEYQPIPALATQRWIALEDGRPVATLDMPARVRLVDVREDVAAGMWFDALGVEHVGLFRVVAGAPEAPRHIQGSSAEGP